MSYIRFVNTKLLYGRPTREVTIIGIVHAESRRDCASGGSNRTRTRPSRRYLESAPAGTGTHPGRCHRGTTQVGTRVELTLNAAALVNWCLEVDIERPVRKVRSSSGGNSPGGGPSPRKSNSVRPMCPETPSSQGRHFSPRSPHFHATRDSITGQLAGFTVDGSGWWRSPVTISWFKEIAGCQAKSARNPGTAPTGIAAAESRCCRPSSRPSS